MHKLLLGSLHQQSGLQIVIESYEGALYQAFVVETAREREHLIWETPRRPLKTRSLIDMRERLQGLELTSLHLRQNSAYDEMVGQSYRQGPNTLWLPVSASLPLPPSP